MSGEFKVLSINTYAGSLLLAAKQAKLEVIASLEDCGYGTDLQQLNFPDVPVVPLQKDWPDRLSNIKASADNGQSPEQPWDKTLVIAHPPCAAFSNQNKSKDRRGTGAGSFTCHTSVMEYALGHGCAALAIESVQGAIAAKEIYEEHAARFGYSVFFIKQNAASFGVPQWRPRLWMIFTKTKTLSLQFKAKYLPVERFVTGKGTLTPQNLAPVRKTKAILDKYMSDEWEGSLLKILTDQDGLDNSGNFMEAREKYNLVGFLNTAMPRWFNRLGFASVVLAESFWWLGKTQLTREDICTIMGFPRDYKFGRHEGSFRQYLSKGICPPVGAWILKMMLANCEGVFTEHRDLLVLENHEVADLQPKRADAEAAAAKNGLAQNVLPFNKKGKKKS